MAKNRYVKTETIELTGVLDLNSNDEIVVIVDEDTIVPIVDVLNSRLGTEITFKSSLVNDCEV